MKYVSKITQNFNLLIEYSFCLGKSWHSTMVKEIPNTSLLVSLFHDGYEAAAMQIFDVSRRDKARLVFSSKEFHRRRRFVFIDLLDCFDANALLKYLFIEFVRSHSSSSSDIGLEDVAYNPRRNLLAAFQIREKIAYHLSALILPHQKLMFLLRNFTAKQNGTLKIGLQHVSDNFDMIYIQN